MYQDLSAQIEKYKREFIQFMGIAEFPKFKIITKDVSLAVADSRGFENAASSFYSFNDNTHTLQFSSNLLLAKYLVFHEFTHVYDTEMYVNGDKIKYAGLSGYTEYHASQIELMQLLGAQNINDKISFSVNKTICTFSGEKSVIQYISEKQHHAIQLFCRPDFPADIEALKVALGVLYNYWGLRSICEMFATDYQEDIQNNSFLKFIPTMNFVLMNTTMHGWLNSKLIENSIPLYLNTLSLLIKQFRLKS